MTDEWIIEVIARRMDEECGFSKASKVLNHESWVDVCTHLFLEKGLRNALLDAYKTELVNARADELLEIEERESRLSAYAERGGGCSPETRKRDDVKWTCDQGHEWNGNDSDEECPVCAKYEKESRDSAYAEWRADSSLRGEVEDIGHAHLPLRPRVK